MTPEQEHEARQRAFEVARLRWHWDGAYEFGWDGQQYWARRADNGASLSAPDLPTFTWMVRLDYCHCAVLGDPLAGA